MWFVFIFLCLCGAVVLSLVFVSIENGFFGTRELRGGVVRAIGYEGGGRYADVKTDQGETIRADAHNTGVEPGTRVEIARNVYRWTKRTTPWEVHSFVVSSLDHSRNDYLSQQRK